MLSKLFVLFLGLALAAASLPGSCSNGVPDISTGSCNCYSSYFGEFCDSQLIDYCAFDVPEKLVTQPVAELMDGTIQANRFSFMVVSPMTEKRFFSQITLNDPACSFMSGSGVERIEPSTETCVDRFVGNFSIPELVQTCNFNSDTASIPNFQVLSGSLSVTAIDFLGTVGTQEVSRTTSNTLSIELRLPLVVSVNSSLLSVTSPIALEAAITKQVFDPVNQVLIVEMITSVQYPYQLDSAFATGRYAVDSGTTTSCSPTADPCIQTHNFTIANMNEICQLIDESFVASFPFSCREECGLTGSEQANVTFTLNTDDACGEMVVISSIGGTMDTFADVARTTPSISFVAGSRIYFFATLNADVTIESIALRSLVLRPVGLDSFEFYNAATPTPYEATLGYQTETSRPPSFAFSFLATFGSPDTSLFDSEGASVTQFDVDAVFEVTYKTTFRKRNVVTETFSLKKTLVLDASSLKA